MSVAVNPKSLVKQLGAVRALDGLSFDIQQSEIHGLIGSGSNGNGKTTTLRIACTLILSTSATALSFASFAQLETATDKSPALLLVFADD